MKYVARTPEEGINVSARHPLVEAGSLIAGIAVLMGLLIVIVFFFIELLLAVIPVKSEARWLAAFSADSFFLAGEGDPRQAEVEALLQRLARHWPDNPYQHRLVVMDDSAPNALALPGGLIVVSTGLLNQVSTENELAFVLGHELGHFQNRDHIRALGRGAVLTLLLRSMVGGSGSGLGESVADFALRRFSRQQEQLADSFGLRLVYEEYGHVNESWRFFARLAEGTEDGASTLAGYLSTHPASLSRIAAIKQEARDNAWSLQGPTLDLAWDDESE